jgi:hypothetical protein
LFKRLSSETFVEMLEEFIKDHELPPSKTVIVVVPSWINCAAVLPMLSSKFHIRSVVSKISASNFFANANCLLTENVLTFCLSGFSQNIVVDAFTEE